LLDSVNAVVVKEFLGMKGVTVRDGPDANHLRKQSSRRYDQRIKDMNEQLAIEDCLPQLEPVAHLYGKRNGNADALSVEIAKLFRLIGAKPPERKAIKLREPEIPNHVGLVPIRRGHKIPGSSGKNTRPSRASSIVADALSQLIGRPVTTKCIRDHRDRGEEILIQQELQAIREEQLEQTQLLRLLTQAVVVEPLVREFQQLAETTDHRHRETPARV
jgi:hypothetical protein